MFKRVPILQGGSDVAQAQMIFDLVGSPTEDSMPGWSLLPGCEGIKDFEISQSKINQRFREYVVSFLLISLPPYSCQQIECFSMLAA